MEQPKYIRLEGSLDEDKIQQIQEFIGNIGVSASLLDTNGLRFERDSGKLFEEFYEIGLVTTNEILFDFACNNLHWREAIATNRTKTIMLALWGHVTFHHNKNDECCGLQAGRVSSPGWWGHTDYIDTRTLVDEFQSGNLDNLPLNPHYNQYTDMSRRKTIGESVCYPLLPAYVQALTDN